MHGEASYQSWRNVRLLDEGLFNIQLKMVPVFICRPGLIFVNQNWLTEIQEFAFAYPINIMSTFFGWGMATI